MVKSLEKSIIDNINRENLSIDESLEFIDDLYWADWNRLEEKYPELIEKIFVYLASEERENREISKILKLYNNPDGSYTDEFAKLILDIYNRNKEKFLKALNLERGEAINLVYIFRMNDVKLDEDQDLINLIDSEILSEEEKETAYNLLKMYENICNTWV